MAGKTRNEASELRRAAPKATWAMLDTGNVAGHLGSTAWSPHPGPSKPCPQLRNLSCVGSRVGGAGKRQIALSSEHRLQRFDEVVTVFGQCGVEFAIHDRCFPSPSDPGAYFAYSPSGGRWRMTLGNHGWSGGVYDIPASTIVVQLHSLFAKGLLRAIDLDRVGFFKHYSPETAEKNQAMVERLQALHAHHA